MSKLALTAVIALVILLLGAGVVFAQSGTSYFGGNMRGMMSTTATGTPTTPSNGTYGPGMMGNTNGAGYGMMGNANGTGFGMMNNVNWDKMRDAMNSGNVDEMVNVCRDAANSTQPGTDNSQTTPQTSAPAGSTTGTTGISTSTRTGTGTRSMMGSRI